MSVYSYIVKHIIAIYQYTQGYETILNLLSG